MSKFVTRSHLPSANSATSAAAALALVAGLALPEPAAAAVKITGITGASVVEEPETAARPGSTPSTSGTWKIYGGTAGVFDSTGSLIITSAGGTVIDTCANPSLAAPLKACNKSAIEPSTLLQITLIADQDGYPVLLIPSGNTTSTYKNVSTYIPSTYTSKGSSTTITVRWSELCTAIAGTTTTSITNQCYVGGTSSLTVDAKIAISDSPSATTTPDTAPTVLNVVVSNSVGQGADGQSPLGTCDAESTGLCHFSIKSGDSKVILKDLRGAGSFPTGAPLNFGWVRLLWVEGNGTFSQITSASSSTDIAVSQTASAELSLSPSRVEGLTNDTMYSFKVAVVDLAGNTGYYTSSAADDYCAYSTTSTGCHIGMPGEVVGVLAKDVNCFVATAAFGSPMAPQVESLRQFRDRFLLPLKWGAAFVRFYYAHSPHYARIIATSDTLRAMARIALWPTVAFAWISINLGFSWAIIAALLFTFGVFKTLAIVTSLGRQFRSRVIATERGPTCGRQA